MNTETAYDQKRPGIAGLNNEDFVVAWQSDGNTEDPDNGSNYGVFGQRYGDPGSSVPEFSDYMLVLTVLIVGIAIYSKMPELQKIVGKK